MVTNVFWAAFVGGACGVIFTLLSMFIGDILGRKVNKMFAKK